MSDSFFKEFNIFTDDAPILNDHLSLEDLKDLMAKAQEMSNNARKSQKLATFLKILDTIFSFCIYGGNIDKQRCYAVGVAFLEDNQYGICVKKLSEIFHRDISGINKNLKDLQFEIVQPRADTNELLRNFFDTIPKKKLKRWSVRKCKNEEINQKYGNILNPINVAEL